MEPTTTESKLAKAVIAVMKEVKGIEKNTTVGTGQNSYKGISDKDVKKTIGDAMVKYGLCIIPTKVTPVIHVDRWEVENNGYKQMKQSVFTECTTEYILMHESGETMPLSGYGHGADSQDKSAGKATTYALKNTLLYLFMVPTGTIDDTDNTHSDSIETKKTPAINPILEKLKLDLTSAKTIEELGQIYLAATPEYRKLTLTLKDQLKEKLTPKTN